MNKKKAYPIGNPGHKWGDKERDLWLCQSSIQRNYLQEIARRVFNLKNHFTIHPYGALSFNTDKYPLYAVTSQVSENRPGVLITGGVHGYESSGVYGALEFLETDINKYREYFNFIIIPCVSPWGFETINRWNPDAIDPNRSFTQNTASEESGFLQHFIAPYADNILAHFDLHETTDTDRSEFRPALCARDGTKFFDEMIPQGFYLVGDEERQDQDFQDAVIASVSHVTRIAEADDSGKILDKRIESKGVIRYPMKQLGLCGSLTPAPYHTTTEVYPDGSWVKEDECNIAQVAAITGGLDYIIKKSHAD